MTMYRLTAAALLAAGVLFGLPELRAANIVFSTAPFEGSTALQTPGRQVSSIGELFLGSFNVATDVFQFNNAGFGVQQLQFINTPSSSLPATGFNLVVLQDSDNDNDPLTAFNAGAAANVIADRITADGAGFFVYYNSSLMLNRLVYSTNLNVNTADLQILARINSPTGNAAIAALPSFVESNFQVVPEPSTGHLFAGASALLVALSRFRKR